MPKSILLVEDEDSIALALEFMMQEEGYRVRRVASGTDALEAIQNEAPDLVLLDVTLPGCSGFEVCQSVRLDERLKDVRILMMTAKASSMVRRKGLALGADDFVAKPFVIQDLKVRVRSLLEEAVN
ncbi:response regulator transcription factor [Pelagibius sp. Alg239-R121]|uniref:response regulator transcription factor n=1 Tax=Pelagibius sp. Alg239-R121 TaxID=2993448 RepID=UPI0024A73619|nr:response regulator [Pelagibius sp. Alg239-R121]